MRLEHISKVTKKPVPHRGALKKILDLISSVQNGLNRNGNFCPLTCHRNSFKKGMSRLKPLIGSLFLDPGNKVKDITILNSVVQHTVI